MAIINYAAREMTAKIVYYGPGLSGKTTSIQFIHTKISPANKGKLVSLATETDRTLFFDFFPVDFGQIGGFKVKFNFYTVPGQVFYNTTRKLVLKNADGVVFVADSQEGMREQNFESLDNLKENLQIHGLDPETIPFAIQYNKRDLPGAMTVDLMRRELNPRGVPDFETNAVHGDGIMETMKAICKNVLEDLRNKQKASSGAPSSAPIAKAPAAAPSAAPSQPEAPAAAPAPQAAVPTAPMPRSVESTATVKLAKSKIDGASLTVPLNLNFAENIDASELEVKVTIAYDANQVSTFEVGEVTQTPPAKKRGFFARLFGG
jgi:signal recognition particle receptor subunit beta